MRLEIGDGSVGGNVNLGLELMSWLRPNGSLCHRDT